MGLQFYPNIFHPCFKRRGNEQRQAKAQTLHKAMGTGCTKHPGVLHIMYLLLRNFSIETGIEKISILAWKNPWFSVQNKCNFQRLHKVQNLILHPEEECAVFCFILEIWQNDVNPLEENVIKYLVML